MGIFERRSRNISPWLRDIYDSVAQDNPESAGRVVLGIYEKAQVLRRLPEVVHRHDAILDRHVLILLYGHYRIA